MEIGDAAMVQPLSNQDGSSCRVPLEFAVVADLLARDHLQRQHGHRGSNARVHLRSGVVSKARLDAGRVVVGEPDVDRLVEPLGGNQCHRRATDRVGDPLEHVDQVVGSTAAS